MARLIDQQGAYSRKIINCELENIIFPEINSSSILIHAERKKAAVRVSTSDVNLEDRRRLRLLWMVWEVGGSRNLSNLSLVVEPGGGGLVSDDLSNLEVERRQQ